jgi:hypothetical protein
MATQINLTIDFNNLKDQLEDLAKQFIADNKDEAIQLGNDVVKAILFSAVSKSITLPTLSPDATPEQVADVTSVLTSNTARFQLIAAAQLQYSESVAKIEASAADVASKVVPIILTALLKPLVGL